MFKLEVKVVPDPVVLQTLLSFPTTENAFLLLKPTVVFTEKVSDVNAIVVDLVGDVTADVSILATLFSPLEF